MNERSSSALSLAALLFVSAFGVNAAPEGTAPPPAVTPENEGDLRHANLVAQDQRLRALYGTSDLSDLTRRALEEGSRAVKKDRELEKEILEARRRANSRGSASSAPALNPAWVSLGPTNRLYPTTIPAEGGTDAGLVASIAISPADPKTYLVGSASGGVWRTTNAGETWALVTSDEGTLQIGAVAYAPSDPMRAYAGTGCADASTYVLGPAWTPGYSAALTVVGIGVLMSTDGGTTWATRTPAGQTPHRVFFQIMVDPTNPDVILTAGEGGLQRSTDGGQSFTAVLQSESAPWTTRIARSAMNPQVLYASTWGPSLPGSVYKSTDAGLTWTEKAAGLPEASERGRTSVAVAPSDPNRVYLLMATAGNKTLGVARSTNGGESWEVPAFDEPSTKILGTQANFAITIAVDRSNPDVLYSGGFDTWKSTDAGTTWTRMSDWFGRNSDKPYVHADQHTMEVTSEGVLLIGNDGGVTATRDGGATFSYLGKGMETFLVSELAEDPANPDRICFGAQDNGPNIRLQGGDYLQPTSGDGFGCLFSRTEPSTILFSVQKQSISRSTDNGRTVGRATEGLTDARGAKATFRTVLLPHPTETETVFTYSRDKVWVSRDFATSWTQLSEDMPVLGAIEDLALQPGNPAKMFLIDSKRQVVASEDGGKNWKKLGEVPGVYLSRLGVGSDGRIWVASRDPRRTKERIWVSADGAEWQSVSRTGETGGLPDLPINALTVDPSSPNVVWAGSFIGLYRTGDGGQTWQRHGTGLPNVPVSSIRRFGSRVRVGTLGRGIWETAADPAASLRGELSVRVAPVAKFSFSPAAPRPGHTVYFTDESTGTPTSLEWNFGDGGRSTEDWPSHVYARVGTYTVTLTARNLSGQSTVTHTVTVASPDTGTGDAYTYLVPVVLTSAGAGGTFFSTELTLANRAGRPLNLTFRVKGTFEGQSNYTLPAGQQVFADVFEFLKTQTGLAVPAGNVVTTLRIEVRGADDLGQFGAQVRVTTPPTADLVAQGISGAFGLSFPALPLKTMAAREAIVYGLQQTSAPGTAGTRSNVACAHAGTGSLGPIRLEVTYQDGETGKAHASKDTLDLTAFEFRQLSQPLASRGLTNGFATVKKVSGDDQFVCYGVLNDNLNGDGSFVPMVVADKPSPVNDGIVPVIVGTDRFKSELTLANRTSKRVGGYFALIPAGTADAQFGEFDIEPGRQYVYADIVAELREAGFNAPNGTVASLYMQFEEILGDEGPQSDPVPISTDKVYAGIRTYASRAGGLFGLAYPLSPVGTSADTEAYVYGLQQSGTQGAAAGTRSNLAVVHALGGEEEILTFEVTYFGPSGEELGKEACDPSPCRLEAGQWRQFNAPLARYGVSQGYARIRRLSGSDQFIAYGVLNDQLNDDGSFAPMIVP